MIPEFTDAISAVAACAKLARSLLDTAGEVKTNEAVIRLQNSILELQGVVYAAQTKYQDLADVKREMEEKLMEHVKWDAEAARYKLHELAPGICVYALKADQTNGEPEHYLCPNCFQQNKKAILHRPAADRTNYVCDHCKFDVRPVAASHPTMESLARYRPSGFYGA